MPTFLAAAHRHMPGLSLFLFQAVTCDLRIVLGMGQAIRCTLHRAIRQHVHGIFHTADLRLFDLTDFTRAYGKSKSVFFVPRVSFETRQTLTLCHTIRGNANPCPPYSFKWHPLQHLGAIPPILTVRPCSPCMEFLIGLCLSDHHRYRTTPGGCTLIRRPRSPTAIMTGDCQSGRLTLSDERMDSVSLSEVMYPLIGQALSSRHPGRDTSLRYLPSLSACNRRYYRTCLLVGAARAPRCHPPDSARPTGLLPIQCRKAKI